MQCNELMKIPNKWMKLASLKSWEAWIKENFLSIIREKWKASFIFRFTSVGQAKSSLCLRCLYDWSIIVSTVLGQLGHASHEKGLSRWFSRSIYGRYVSLGQPFRARMKEIPGFLQKMSRFFSLLGFQAVKAPTDAWKMAWVIGRTTSR